MNGKEERRTVESAESNVDVYKNEEDKRRNQKHEKENIILKSVRYENKRLEECLIELESSQENLRKIHAARITEVRKYFFFPIFSANIFFRRYFFFGSSFCTNFFLTFNFFFFLNII